MINVLKHRIKTTSSGYVFSNSEGRKLTHLTGAFKSAVEDAGLFHMEGGKKVRFRFHGLRHTFGARLGMKGFGLKTIIKIMGYKTASSKVLKLQKRSIK